LVGRAVTTQADADYSAGGGELYGIRYQVEDHLLEPVGIASGRQPCANSSFDMAEVRSIPVNAVGRRAARR